MAKVLEKAGYSGADHDDAAEPPQRPRRGRPDIARGPADARGRAAATRRQVRRAADRRTAPAELGAAGCAGRRRAAEEGRAEALVVARGAGAAPRRRRILRLRLVDARTLHGLHRRRLCRRRYGGDRPEGHRLCEGGRRSPTMRGVTAGTPLVLIDDSDYRNRPASRRRRRSPRSRRRSPASGSRSPPARRRSTRRSAELASAKAGAANAQAGIRPRHGAAEEVVRHAAGGRRGEGRAAAGDCRGRRRAAPA